MTTLPPACTTTLLQGSHMVVTTLHKLWITSLPQLCHKVVTWLFPVCYNLVPAMHKPWVLNCYHLVATLSQPGYHYHLHIKYTTRCRMIMVLLCTYTSYNVYYNMFTVCHSLLVPTVGTLIVDSMCFRYPLHIFCLCN